MGLFAGIDVAKDKLAVALSSGQEWSCANDARGITLLVERLEAANPALVVLEATGGYEEVELPRFGRRCWAAVTSLC